MENTIYKKLLAIQSELKCPKNLFNKFGNYNYRNAETILENAKPLCAKNEVVLTVGDEIVVIGERYYVKATATLTDCATGATINNVAYAREDEDKKGMDGSQITGSCSSYARKYALNGLFCLDDIKDADTDEQHEQLANSPDNKPATEAQRGYIEKLYTDEEIEQMLQRLHKGSTQELTVSEACKMINARKGK